MANVNTVDDLFENIKANENANVQEIELAQRLSSILYDISEARINQGLSQQKLADICGLKQSAIARLESLQTIPRLDTVLRVATALKLRVEIVPERESVPTLMINYSNKRVNTTEYHYQSNYDTFQYSLPFGKVAV